jgi:hypothetical protein
MRVPAGWTLETYAVHNEALREAEVRFQVERDRRYAEVKSAEEKALAVKQRADDQALLLARDIQTYKDEKANELREQINRERGLYATHADVTSLAEKFEAMHKPVVEFMASVQGRGIGAQDNRALISWGLLGLIALIGLGSFVFGELKNPAASPVPQVIVMPAPMPPTTTTTTTVPAAPLLPR